MLFSEQNYLIKKFSWLKREWMNVKCLSCRDVQIVTRAIASSVHGQSNCRLLIKGSSGLSHTFLRSNSHLYQLSGQINPTESYYLFYCSIRLVFRLFYEFTLLSVHSHDCQHWCNGDFRDMQPTVNMNGKSLGTSKKLPFGLSFGQNSTTVMDVRPIH